MMYPFFPDPICAVHQEPSCQKCIKFFALIICAVFLEYIVISNSVRWNIPLNQMSHKMECHLKLNVTLNEVLLKMECHSKWNITQTGMSLKTECHSKWKVTLDIISLKMDCHSK